jgi:predicted transcriptional regulator
MEGLTKSQRAEFDNIAANQPVFAGNLQSHQDAKDLMDKGLVMRYEGEYVLTEKGKELKSNLEGAAMLAKKSVVNQWAKKNY